MSLEAPLPRMRDAAGLAMGLLALLLVCCVALSPNPLPVSTPSLPARVNSVPGVFCVTDFGAVGDGVHHDADAFQNAVKAASAYPVSSTSCAVVLIPPGRPRYLIEHSVILGQHVDIETMGRPELMGANKNDCFYYAPAWQNHIGPLTFRNFGVAVRVDFQSPVSASALFELNQPHFFDCGLSIDTVNFARGRSASFVLNQPFASYSQAVPIQFARFFCDHVVINQGEIDCPCAPGQGPVIVLDSLARVNGTMLIPSGGKNGSLDTAVWFEVENSDNARGFLGNDIRASSEGCGGIPLLQFDGYAQDDYGANDSGGVVIHLVGCYTSAFGAAPGRCATAILNGPVSDLSIEGGFGGCDLDGIVAAGPNFKAPKHPQAMHLRIDQSTQQRKQMLMNPRKPVSDALLPYLEKP